MEIRLNMLDLKTNFRGMYEDTICTGCFKCEETTEHFLQCEKMMDITQHNVKTNDLQKDINSTEWLIKMAEQIEVLQEVRTHRLRYKKKVL